MPDILPFMVLCNQYINKHSNKCDMLAVTSPLKRAYSENMLSREIPSSSSCMANMDTMG